jgi:hypothetical protein
MPAGQNATSVTGKEKWSAQPAKAVGQETVSNVPEMDGRSATIVSDRVVTCATNAMVTAIANVCDAAAMEKRRIINAAKNAKAPAAGVVACASVTVERHADTVMAVVVYPATYAAARASAPVTCAAGIKPSDATSAREINITSSGSEYPQIHI